MKMTKRHRLLFAAGVLTAGAVVKSANARRQRQKLLDSGQLRKLHTAWYEVGGQRIYARIGAPQNTTPDSLPIVLVHGLGVASSYFVPLAERLAPHFRVYAPDLPGHGHSATPPRPLDIAGLTRALLDWMTVAGLPRAILLGHSLGAQLAVEAALLAPDRVDRLVLIGLTPDPAARSTLRLLGRFLIGGLYERPSLIPLLLNDYLRMGWRYLPEFDAMRSDPIERKLPLVPIPSLLVRGQHDTLSTQPWFDTAARLLRTKNTLVIPRWGHAVQYGDPADLVNALLPYLTAENHAHSPASAST